MRYWLLAVSVFGLTALAGAQRRLVEMEVRPLFGTAMPPFGCLPLKITAQNNGPSVDATLVVSVNRLRGDREHVFPLPLPTGSRKEFLALPFVLSDTTGITVQLRGVREVLKQTISVFPSNQIRLVVGLGDEMGGLEWLRHLNPQQPTTSSPVPMPPVGRPGSLAPIEWVWAYCRPEELPNKIAALTGVSVLVLSPGAERLTLSQWQAIRQWVAMGGVLVVPGGPAAIYLRHRLLASLLPIRNLKTVQWQNWQALTQWSKTEPPRNAAFITVGELTEESSLVVGTAKLPLISIRPYGFGVVIFTAFNFWDKPFREWKGLPAFWQSSVRGLALMTVAHRWSLWLLPLGVWQGWQYSRWPSVQYYNPYTPFSTTGTLPTPLQPPPLPFRLELPSALSIGVTLLVYFLLLIPTAYFLLQKRRALDWHWLVAPVIAVAFVFVIGRAAFGLYQLGVQNLTRGLVVTTSGEPNAYLFAAATLFLQRAGSYLLDFGLAEAVFTAVEEDSPTAGTALQTQEGGANITTLLRVPNLSFRLFYFVKPLTLNGTVQVQVQRKDNRFVVTVENQLPYALKEGDCALVRYAPVARRRWYRDPPVGLKVLGTTRSPAIPPGQKITLTLPFPAQPDGRQEFLLVLTAPVEGMDITPNLDVPSHRQSFVTLRVVHPIPDSVVKRGGLLGR